MHERLDALPADRAHRTGMAGRWRRPHLYFEECGNPNGQPALFVHGGPGGGSNPTMRRFHDPTAIASSLFDQRGCGRSTPNASLEDNTTWHLVADMERLRKHLGIERWQVFGGSWGSTLALAYAETHPERVERLVLRGIFLARRSRARLVLSGGLQLDLSRGVCESIRTSIPPDERGDMIAAYHRRLTSNDPRCASTRRQGVEHLGRRQRCRSFPNADASRASAPTPTRSPSRASSATTSSTPASLRRDGQLLLEAQRITRHSRRHRARPLRRRDADQERLGAE